MPEILGKCAACGCGVVLVEVGAGGWRFCWGCNARGPEVVLVGESVTFVEGDDPTIVDLDNSELCERCREVGP